MRFSPALLVCFALSLLADAIPIVDNLSFQSKELNARVAGKKETDKGPAPADPANAPATGPPARGGTQAGSSGTQPAAIDTRPTKDTNEPTQAGSPSSAGAAADFADDQTTADPKAINKGPKNILFDGETFKGPLYPMSPIDPQGKNIKAEYPNLHGIWLGKTGTKEVEKVTDAKGAPIETDHVLEAQLISMWAASVRGALKTGKEPGKMNRDWFSRYLRANHDPSYMTPSTKPVPAKNLDFTKDNYKGSLLQHMLLELGSLQRQDRLAVIETGINRKKGTLMKGYILSPDTIINDAGKEKLKPIDSAMQAVQIDAYMLSEMDSFCASIDGIFDILKKFDGDMKKKAGMPPDFSGLTLDDKPKPRPAGQASAPGIPGDKTYAEAVNTPKKPKRDATQPSRRDSLTKRADAEVPPKRPQRGPPVDYSGAQPVDPTPEKQRMKDPNVDPNAGKKAKIAEVRGPANIPAVRSDLANRWKMFLQTHFSENTVKNMNTFYKDIATKAGANAFGDEKKQWAEVAEFKATWFEKAMRTCKTFTSPANIDTGASNSGSSASPSPLDGKGNKEKQLPSPQRPATPPAAGQEPVITHKKKQPKKQNNQLTGSPTT